jgi:HK97 gp10 family phage protein
MMDYAHVDTTGWMRKLKACEGAALEAMKRAVDFGMDEINKGAVRNLSGPHYKHGTRGPRTGQMPIPRVTGTLARSLTSKRFHPTLGVIYADKKVANYAGFVHDGTRFMKPRRFLSNVVQERKAAIVNRWKYEILLAIRREGQKP